MTLVAPNHKSPASLNGSRSLRRSKMKISQAALDQARLPAGMAPRVIRNPFEPYVPPRKVAPPMAMDDASFPASFWSADQISTSGQVESIFEEGQSFLGYPELALMAQRAEYRVITETIATEMTRKWLKLNATGDEDKSDKIAAIEAEFDRLKLRDAFRKIAEQDGFFGRAHLYLDTGDGEDREELKVSIGDGRSDVSRAKISPKRPLKKVKAIEAVWSYPAMYNANDPLKGDWYKPTAWFVMGKEIHASRFLTFIGREVPDLLKPAYAFGGLSLSQMCRPYVQNWLVTRQSVQDIIKAFTNWVLKTNLSGILSGGADDFQKRLVLFNTTRRNSSVMAVDMDTEDFANVSAPLGTLDHLQAQAQEHMASVSRIPLVKFTGISPSGLNASSEGELRCFEDVIHAYQEAFFLPNLMKILGFVQLSLYGEIDKEIGIEFLSINEMTDKEKAELAQVKATTGQILMEGGAVSQYEERKRIAEDPDTPYPGLDIEEMPDLAQEEQGGLEGGGGEGGTSESLELRQGGFHAGGGASEGGFKGGADSAFGLDVKDKAGHEHKGKGPGGGQFTSGGSGEAGAAPKTETTAKSDPETTPAERWGATYLNRTKGNRTEAIKLIDADYKAKGPSYQHLRGNKYLLEAKELLSKKDWQPHSDLLIKPVTEEERDNALSHMREIAIQVQDLDKQAVAVEKALEDGKPVVAELLKIERDVDVLSQRFVTLADDAQLTGGWAVPDIQSETLSKFIDVLWPFQEFGDRNPTAWERYMAIPWWKRWWYVPPARPPHRGGADARVALDAKDDSGHEHAPAGSPKGGQFVSQGGGGSAKPKAVKKPKLVHAIYDPDSNEVHGRFKTQKEASEFARSVQESTGQRLFLRREEAPTIPKAPPKPKAAPKPKKSASAVQKPASGLETVARAGKVAKAKKTPIAEVRAAARRAEEDLLDASRRIGNFKSESDYVGSESHQGHLKAQESAKQKYEAAKAELAAREKPKAESKPKAPAAAKPKKPKAEKVPVDVAKHVERLHQARTDGEFAAAMQELKASKPTVAQLKQIIKDYTGIQASATKKEQHFHDIETGYTTKRRNEIREKISSETLPI